MRSRVGELYLEQEELRCESDSRSDRSQSDLREDADSFGANIPAAALIVVIFVEKAPMREENHVTKFPPHFRISKLVKLLIYNTTDT